MVGATVVVATAGCSSAPRGTDPETARPSATGGDAPAPPDPGLDVAPLPGGPLPAGTVELLDAVLADPVAFGRASPVRLGATGDVRVAWPLVDLLRFHEGSEFTAPLVLEPLAQLTGWRPPPGEVAWVAYADALLQAEVPAPPGYLGWKRQAFDAIDARWAPFFDPAADLDWRHVSWGGVLRDGIVALTDPTVAAAGEPAASWLPDDDVVFGVVAGGEARAYPRRVLEVHELVNDTVGGRRVALPYCTLCGTAVAYHLDGTGIDELRTSGLLLRSNKLMYDPATESLLDQFAGAALTGPLAAAGLTLDPVEVVVARWRDWRAAHPGTTVLAADQGTGRAYTGDFIGDRDAGGPIFPVGDVDERLPAATEVLGAVTADEAAVAFPVAEARAAITAGRPVAAGGVEVVERDGGLVARATAGGAVRFQEARWFAWSQFRPGTVLWRDGG